MAERKDGIKSKEKLIEAASEVFAEKGYKTATVADICSRAGVNVASINYHFGSKDELYCTVWRTAFEKSMQVYPADGGLGPDAVPEQQLYALIRSSLHRILDDGRLGCAGQILLREIAEPTGVIEQIVREVLGPLRERTQRIIRSLLGSEPSEQDLFFCELSVVHQCIAIGFGKSRGKLPPFFKDNEPTSELIDKLAEHITLFSLAGIYAIRKQSEKKQTTKS